jgi:hypothetical protein
MNPVWARAGQALSARRRESDPRRWMHKEEAYERMTQTDCQYEKVKKRCVGSLDDVAVYFVGSRMGFHLAIEESPGEFRRLSESEHLRFKQQSRIKGLPYEQ